MISNPATKTPAREKFGYQSGNHLIHRQRVERKNQLLDEIAVFQNHCSRASHGFGEREPGQHARQEIERETGAALVGSETALQHDAEDEEVRRHQQQRIENRPKHVAKGSAIASQNIAPRHGPDQPVVLSDGSQRRGEEPGQRGPDSPPAQRADRGDLLGQNAKLAVRPVRGSFHQNPQKRFAARVRPASGRLYVRDINLVAAGFRRKRDRDFELRGLTRGNIAGDGRPRAFLDEQVRLRIEELPAQREVFRRPGLARTCFRSRARLRSSEPRDRTRASRYSALLIDTTTPDSARDTGPILRPTA